MRQERERNRKRGVGRMLTVCFFNNNTAHKIHPDVVRGKKIWKPRRKIMLRASLDLHGYSFTYIPVDHVQDIDCD